jgi:hypothetical protein
VKAVKEPVTERAAPIEPTLLQDSAVDGATLKDLRRAYRALRAAYVELHKRHHERITEALADRKEEGKKTGGDVPYGYRLDSDGETLIKDEAEQAVIAEVVRLRGQRFSFRRIVQELWKQQLRPRPISEKKRRRMKGQRLKGRRRGEFDPTQIRRMIEARKSAAE